MGKCKNCGHEIEKVKGHYNHKTTKKHIGKILSFPCHYCDCNEPERITGKDFRRVLKGA